MHTRAHNGGVPLPAVLSNNGRLRLHGILIQVVKDEAVNSIARERALATHANKLALMVDNEIFKIIMLVILPVTAVLVLNKRTLGKYRSSYTVKKTIAVIALLSLVMGLYDGFYGPGTGTFLMLLLVCVARLGLERAVGTTKVINLSTNVASLSVFIAHGKVLFPLALVAALFGIAGNYIGAKYFTKNGTGFVKPLIALVLSVFFVKLCCELFLSK